MSRNIFFYKVGGCVRDELLGQKPKDIDYTVVIQNNKEMSVSEGFVVLEQYLVSLGYTIFLKTESTFTIRAKSVVTNEIVDFVLARKELYYREDTREPVSVLGTLEEDLIRRDFTINAMCIDEDGTLIDMFGGRADLEKKILRTPLDAEITMLDDPLRLFRALRFAITKGMKLDETLIEGLKNEKIYEKLWRVVSADRVREELMKMFAYDTVKTLEMLTWYTAEIRPHFLRDIFEKTGMWLKPTSEKRLNKK